MGDRYSVPDMFTAFGIEDRNVFFGGVCLGLAQCGCSFASESIFITFAFAVGKVPSAE